MKHLNISYFCIVRLKIKLAKDNMPIAFINPTAFAAFYVISKIAIQVRNLATSAVNIHANVGAFPLYPSMRLWVFDTQ